VNSGYSPARNSQWMVLADALDAAVVTLHAAVPDPLWFGPSRQAFDSTAGNVEDNLRNARWAVLSVEMLS